MITDDLREKANRLPLLPGVYLMLNEKKEVIYVGKAKALKNRVTSYFRGEHEPKTAAMVEKVRDFNVIVAASEFEALVLENSLIKRYQPHYNILLRDDKTYPFIRLEDSGDYPRFSIVNRRLEDGAKYFGPFGGRSMTREIIDTVSKALGLPTCGKSFPRDLNKGRPCLNYHMGSCPGYCVGKAGTEEYAQAIADAEVILKGGAEKLVEDLTREMEAASEDLRFEQAAKYRDRLRAIEGLFNRQKVIGASASDVDAVGFYREAKSCFTVLRYAGGDLISKEYEMLEEPLEDDAEAVSALVRQFYTIRGVWPSTLLLPVETEDMEDIAQMLTEASGHKVNVYVPKRGEKKLMVEKAMINAREECIRATTAQQRRMKTLAWLQEALGMDKLPRRIEAFDISNTGNFGIVASMIVFVDGKPLKSGYRKFKMKEQSGQDDYGSMREALTRRFKRYLQGDEKFSQLPDLLLIDGGSVHAGTAEQVLHELGISLTTVGMVKDDRHRTRALTWSDGREVGITGNPAAFALIGNIQEETHRFAIEYHRSLRSASIGTKLENIKGVGEVRRNQLLKHFKSVKAISAASLQELEAAVPKNTAKAVYEYFHTEENSGAAPEGREKQQ